MEGSGLRSFELKSFKPLNTQDLKIQSFENLDCSMTKKFQGSVEKDLVVCKKCCDVKYFGLWERRILNHQISLETD